MRIWHEGIYGNDDAQEFLDVLVDLFETCETGEEFVSQARNHPDTRFSACQLVLADFEADFVGEIEYPQDILTLIERESSAEVLAHHENPEQRRQVLEGFQRSLTRRLARPFYDCLSFSEFPAWLEAKQTASWLESIER